MQINNVDLSTDFVLMDYTINQTDITNKVENINPSCNPFSVEDEKNVGTIDIEMNVYGDTLSELIKNIGLLIEKLRKSVIKFDDLDYYLSIAYDKKEEEKPFEDIMSNKWCENITFSMYILKMYTSEVVVNFNNAYSCNIINSGTKKSSVTLEITPSVEADNIEISGLSEDTITINDLTANQKIIVNGELETVTEEVNNECVNKYGDTDMWEYPSLKSGSNTVTTNINTCSIKIKYNPQY